MKYPVITAILVGVVLMGAGCMDSSRISANTTNENSATAQEDDRLAEGSTKNDPNTSSDAGELICPSGTEFFEGSSLNIRFCYPKTDDNGLAVTVKEQTDGVILLVDGIAVRKVGVVGIDPNKSREDIVMAYANPKSGNAVCMAVRGNVSESGRVSYGIQGTIADEVSLDSMAQCGDSPALRALMGEFFNETFLFFSSDPTVMLVLSGEQDASLGYTHTKDFEDSLRPYAHR